MWKAVKARWIAAARYPRVATWTKAVVMPVALVVVTVVATGSPIANVEVASRSIDQAQTADFRDHRAVSTITSADGITHYTTTAEKIGI